MSEIVVYQKGNYFPPVSPTPWNKISKKRKLELIKIQGEIEAEQVRIFFNILIKQDNAAETINSIKLAGRKKNNNPGERSNPGRTIEPKGLFG